MTVGKKIKESKIKWWMCAAAIHFALTFVWSSLIFQKGRFDIGLVELSRSFSDEAERLVHTVYAKALALLLILLLWWLADKVRSGRIPRKQVITFLCTLGILTILIGMGFPENFYSGESDNLLTFAHAIRNQPFYWHGALTSIYYAACFYVFPHPFSVQLLTLTAVSAILVLGWFRVKGMRLFLLIALFLPETYEICTTPYRTKLYTVLLVLTLFLVLDLRQSGRKVSQAGRLVFLFLFAVLAVWRTEGVFFAIGLFLVLFPGTLKNGWKSDMKSAVLFLCFSVLLSAPQKMGNEKYHGKDYRIITTTEWLPACLNSSGANLSYEGAEEDLAAIDRVVPVDMIRALGSRAFHMENVHSGRSVIQTACSKEEAQAYMKAAYRIVLHNPISFLKGRFNLAMNANGGEFFLGVGEYDGEPIPFDYAVYDPIQEWYELGKAELLQRGFCGEWARNGIRSSVEKLMDAVRAAWSDTLNLRFTLFTAAGIYLVVWLVRLCRSRAFGRSDWQSALLICIALGEIGIITVGAPETRPAYYYPVYYFLLALMCQAVLPAAAELIHGKEVSKG